TVRFYVNNALIDTKTILSLLPTEAIILSTTWVATPAGNYTIKVVIDPDNMIAESDETNNEATKLLTIVVENIPPVADFVFYQGVRAVHGEVLNITLRVAGEKGAIVNLTVYENGIKVGFISVERIPGPPQENTTAVVIDASKLYTILLERSARKEGENPVWVIVECKGVSNMTHYVFQENDTKELNLTHTIDQMLLATGFVKFDARFPISYDPDGTIINYTWSFGDGFYGYGEIVYHNYAPGNYIVNLTVRDDDGAIGIVTKTITILEQTGDFANSRKQFGIALRCPADLTITNGTGAFVGLNVSSGRHENWIPNASVIIAGDIEIYFAPGDFNYTYTIRGLGPGDFVLVFAPGDFAPGDFSYRIYELESSTNAQTQDILRITQNGDKIILT
ncbi:MAG: PKD domain-containing protein, partial [Candidatus Thermoplasmatota archaeon]